MGGRRGTAATPRCRRLLFARDADGHVADARAARRRRTRSRSRASASWRVGGAGLRERRARGAPRAAARRGRAPRRGAAASWPRPRSTASWTARWRRTSYSDITAGAHEARVASEPEEPALDDEPDASRVVDGLVGRSVGLPLGGMPGGARFGTFVHRVLEATDFAAADLELELATTVREVAGAAAGRDRAQARGRRRAAGGARDAARAAGRRPPAVRRGARRPARRARLRAAAGGRRRAAGEVTLAAIGALLREHLGARRPARRLRRRGSHDPALRASRARLPDRQHRPRRAGSASAFAIVDYKTNWLAGPGEELTAWHYRAGGARGRDAARALRRCRRCCTRSRCTATCAGGCPATTPERHLAACSTCSCAG